MKKRLREQVFREFGENVAPLLHLRWKVLNNDDHAGKAGYPRARNIKETKTIYSDETLK